MHYNRHLCVIEFPVEPSLEPHVAALKMCKKYYPELTSVLFTTDLSPYFVSKEIISIDDEENIDNAPTMKSKAKILLRIVFNHLEGGSTKSLTDMLNIMEQHGTKAITDLASKIKCDLHVS